MKLKSIFPVKKQELIRFMCLLDSCFIDPFLISSQKAFLSFNFLFFLDKRLYVQEKISRRGLTLHKEPNQAAPRQIINKTQKRTPGIKRNPRIAPEVEGSGRRMVQLRLKLESQLPQRLSDSFVNKCATYYKKE